MTVFHPQNPVRLPLKAILGVGLKRFCSICVRNSHVCDPSFETGAIRTERHEGHLLLVSPLQNKKIYLDIIHTYMEVHATVYGSSTKNIPSYVKNHGILSGRDLQFLLRETKVSFWWFGKNTSVMSSGLFLLVLKMGSESHAFFSELQ